MSNISTSATGPISLSAAIEIYAEQVSWVDTYDEPLEVSNCLVWRESIAERLSAGMTMSEDDKKRLAEADEALRAKGPRLYRRHPQVFDDNRDSVPEDYWWWKLGPGEEARAR